MALLGAVSGGGTVTLEGAQLDALSPKAFDTLTRAVDRGMVLDTPRIQDVTAAALAGGRLVVPRLDADVTVADGQFRLGTAIAHGQGADLALAGKFDIAQTLLDARLTLSGPAGPNSSGLRPDVFVTLKGPAGAVKRSLDVSNLAGWLTLRAVEQQASRLEAAEANRRETALTPDRAAPGGKPGAEGAKDPPAAVVAIPPAQPEATGALPSPGLPNPIDVRPALAPFEKRHARPPARTAGPWPPAGARPPIHLRRPPPESAVAPQAPEQFPLNSYGNP
jgi:large subunit ribosomal protein L24